MANLKPPMMRETLEGGAMLYRLPEARSAGDSAEKNIGAGCDVALKGIALALLEIEGELEWLLDDLPRLNGGWAPLRDGYERKICDYQRRISTLTEALRVLEELAAEARAAPCQ